MPEIKSLREVESLLGVLQFTVKILFPRHHHVLFPLFSSLFIAYKNQKKREVHVKIQPVPDELLLKLNSQSHFQSDIHNCAFVNDKILSILNVRTGYWIKVAPHNYGKEIPEKNNECIDTVDSNSGIQYCLLRVIGVSCIESSTAHVSYVTFHNLDRTFHIRDLVFLTSFENFIPRNLSKFKPHFASRAVVNLVKCTVEIEESILDKSLSRFFENAKYLCKGDIFTIDTVQFVPEILYNSECYNCKKLHFVVYEIVGPDYELNKNINLGYYVLKGETTLIQSKNCQTYLPPIHQMINCNFNSFAKNQYLSFLISVSPPGLCKYSSELSQCIKPFIQTISQLRNSNIKPLFLISGPRGSGKKLVVTSVAKQLGLNIWIVNCCDIQCNTAASTEAKLKSVFNKAKEFVPCIVLLKNIELLCVNKHDMEDIRIINAFNEEVRNMNHNHGNFPVIIVATCTSKNEQLSNLSAALARAFLSTIWISFPDETERLLMLEWMTKFYGMNIHSEVSLKPYATQTSGFHFGDLSAFMSYATRNFYKDFTDSIDPSLRKKDFDKALGLMQNIFSDAIGAPKVPAVSWEDVGGLSDLKEEIIRTIMLPIKHPELVSTGLRSGLLLFGPPGTGKTLLAKAVATECGLNFLSVKGPELLNMYVGQSEENVRDVFGRARSASPCIIFFDELDSLAPNRGRSGDSGGVMDRVVSQLLAEMDGIQKSTKIFVIGATNRPDLIDPALLRPGRFDKLLYVGMCSDTASKLSVLKSLTRKFKLKPEVNLNEVVASLPENVTGADIYSVCSTAWLNAVRTIIHEQKFDNESNEASSQLSLMVVVGVEDFAAGTRALIPSVSVDDMNYYKKIRHHMSS